MDLSVLPTQISGNPNGPVIAMAWRASEIIAEDLAMAREQASRFPEPVAAGGRA
jgi:choline dehydrogenase-like flavoprotein